MKESAIRLQYRRHRLSGFISHNDGQNVIIAILKLSEPK
jgi:hypothetical protein